MRGDDSQLKPPAARAAHSHVACVEMHRSPTLHESHCALAAAGFFPGPPPSSHACLHALLLAAWAHLNAARLALGPPARLHAAGAGVQVQLGKLTGFLPYKLLDPTRLPQRKPGGGLPPVPARGYQELVGQPVKVKVTQVGACVCGV